LNFAKDPYLKERRASMNHKLGIGLIGCGRIGQIHLSSVKYLRDEINLVAVADPNREAAIQAAKKFGAQKYYFTAQEMMTDPQIEAVIIALPHHLHCPITIEAHRAGKHVLVEKPMALNLKEADQMIAEAKKNKVVLMVGQSWRFSDAAMQAHKRRGEIGQIFRIIVTALVHFPKPPTSWWKSPKKTGGLRGMEETETVGGQG